METLLGSDTPLNQKAWHLLKGWYQAASDRAPSPAWVTLKWITVEQVELYNYVPPPGANIPIYVEPFQVDYLVPTEDKIELAVKRLRNHHSGEPSEIQAKHMKGWLAAANRKEREEVVAKH